MPKIVIEDDTFPPGGPYSIAVKAGKFIFCGSRWGGVPTTNEKAAPIEVQTRKALTDLKIILEGAEASFEDVIKTTVLMADMNEFPKMNAVYAKFFPIDPPTRSTIGAILPSGVKVAIDLVAYVGDNCTN